ncbi:MAG: phosphodiester glycosidase family protein [Phototrophicales bacterium]|nr:phosphodiester glycosidase family protein [Phototrophicales bacterium]
MFGYKGFIGVIFGMIMLLLSGCFQDASNALAPVPQTDWRTLATGLEERTIEMDNNPILQLYVLRIDPTHYRFEAHYQPNETAYIDDWRTAHPTAQIIMNANFFDVDDSVLGLFISHGVTFGRSYTDRGGTFAITDNIPTITHNIYEPIIEDMTTIQHAVQGFPMLVYNGEASFDQAGSASRRSAIGIDEQGRVLLIVTPIFGPSLSDLSTFLATSDLELVDAFNLDGGRSTMMYVAETSSTLRSFERVPAILAVYTIETEESP